MPEKERENDGSSKQSIHKDKAMNKIDFMRTLAVFQALIGFMILGEIHAAELISAHGIAMNGTPRYSEGFKHFDYVNPEASKGGRWVVPTHANFNSRSPSGEDGIVAPDAYWITHDRLLERSGDESSAFYGD